MKLQPKTYNLQPQRGFTLIESVVATGIFAFVIVATMGVYLSTIQLDRKSRAQRAVAQNGRFIMEYLAKEVRNGSINYASYPGGLASGTNDLYLENQSNVIEHLFLNGTNMVLNKDGSDTNLNSSSVQVTKLKFYIQPIGDPLTTAKNYNEQPRVTIVLELSSNSGTAAKEIVKLNLQGTFTGRVYPSRQ
jgi:prepilin-type N-terminal cleavage/methylation domain-containing protein